MPEVANAKATLSKVEHDRLTLTYDKLLQLTSGLKMEIAELFNPAPPRPEPSLPPPLPESIPLAGWPETPRYRPSAKPALSTSTARSRSVAAARMPEFIAPWCIMPGLIRAWTW